MKDRDQTDPSRLPLEEAGALVPLERLEAAIADHALAFHDGNISRAAKALGIARTTLYRKLGKVLPPEEQEDA